MERVRLGVLAVVLGIFAVHAAVLFGCAGRLDLPMFWAMLGLWLGFALLSTLTMPAGLLRERLKPGPGAKERWFRPALIALYLGMLVTCGLDAGRFHDPSPVARPVQAAALAAMFVVFTVALWAMRSNPFFSSVVRIQADRGHRVVTGGPYRFVRHPAYAAFLWMPMLAALVLGSWLALVFGPFMAAGFVARTAIEDRALRAELPGYAEYAERVRYRLVPGVW